MGTALRRTALGAALAVLLASCGGGGDDTAEASAGSGPLAAQTRPSEDGASDATVIRGSVPSAPGASQIVFAGHTFQVRSGAGGPGPNTWSAQNVWVDARGQLHLKIANREGQWSSAEIYTTEALGFGKYAWRIAGDPGALDDNVVLGLFNYPTKEVGPDGTNEIDIEFATWGGAQPQHGNWTVWPTVAGHDPVTYAFNPVAKDGAMTYQFNWKPASIDFGIGKNPPTRNENRFWRFAPDNAGTAIPQLALPLHMNLWLFQGQVPTDGKEVEVVITGFEFQPARVKTRR